MNKIVSLSNKRARDIYGITAGDTTLAVVDDMLKAGPASYIEGDDAEDRRVAGNEVPGLGGTFTKKKEKDQLGHEVIFTGYRINLVTQRGIAALSPKRILKLYACVFALMPKSPSKGDRIKATALQRLFSLVLQLAECSRAPHLRGQAALLLYPLDNKGLTSWSARPENLIFSIGYGPSMMFKSAWELRPGEKYSGMQLRLVEKNNKDSAIRSAGSTQGQGTNLVQLIADTLSEHPPVRLQPIFSGLPNASMSNGKYYLNMIVFLLKLMANKLGFPTSLFGTHVLRNFAPHQLAAAGFSRDEIKDHTGHKDPQSLDPYLTPNLASHGFKVAEALHTVHTSTAHTVASFMARKRVACKSRYTPREVVAPLTGVIVRPTNNRKRHTLAQQGRLKRKVVAPIKPVTPAVIARKRKIAPATNALNPENPYKRSHTNQRSR